MGRGIEFYAIAKAFSEIGLSFQTVFPDVDIAIELYKNHNWYVRRKKNFTIIHAVPLVHLLDNSFWEQWSSTKLDPPNHQVLFRRTPPVPHQDIYEAKADHDEINPVEVSGSIWYVVKVSNPRGWALNIL